MSELTSTGELLKVKKVSARQLKRADAIERTRALRETEEQPVAFSNKYFILCGLPVKRPPAEELVHTRHNGNTAMSLVAHPNFGLPFGQDRLILIWAATIAVAQDSPNISFKSGAEILKMFGLALDGRKYKRLVEGFQRLSTTSMYYGPRDQSQKFHVEPFHLFKSAQLWYQEGESENHVALSDRFWTDLKAHPIPIDLGVVRALADSPGCLDFYLWVCWRCWSCPGSAIISLYGQNGLIHQLGTVEEERFFRRALNLWLAMTVRFWPACPARISDDGMDLILSHGQALPAGD